MLLNSIWDNSDMFWSSSRVFVAPYTPETGPITKQRSLQFIKVKTGKSMISSFWAALSAWNFQESLQIVLETISRYFAIKMCFSSSLHPETGPITKQHSLQFTKAKNGKSLIPSFWAALSAWNFQKSFEILLETVSRCFEHQNVF